MPIIKNYSIATLIILSLLLATSLFAENPHRDQVPIMLRFAAPQLPDSNLIPVEFEFHHALASGDAGVGINGSFNGWGDVYKCKNIGGDTWVRVLHLAPGRYQYKFVTYVDTVGQAGVTGWYTDPLNPEFGGPYRDSYLTVTDPMIYYFLPIRDSEISIKNPGITAKMTTALKNSLMPESIKFTIDGTDITEAWNYFDPLTKKFNYTPPLELEYGDHFFKLSVTNSEGVTGQGATNFRILRGIIEAPYTLMFDGLSPVLELVEPVHDVIFEWRDDVTAEELYDPDGDGIFTRTLNLRVNKPRIYRVIVNENIYLEADPTNPVISEEWRSVVRKVVASKPKFVDFTPAPGTVFNSIDTMVTFSTWIVPSDSNYAINTDSIFAWFDDQPVALSWEAAGDTIVAIFAAVITEGQHVIRYLAKDIINMATSPAYATVAAYAANTGFHYIDAVFDDNGYGNYQYPSDIAAGSADIRAVHIQLNELLDSLKIAIDMENISDFTRIGLTINNNLDGSLVPVLDNLELRLPDWQSSGVYSILAVPEATTLRPGFDNQAFSSHTPLQPAFQLSVNENALLTNQFRLTLAIVDLEQLLGTFNQSWHFIIFSYLARSDGSVEITKSIGGVREAEDPDVFDLAFCPGLQVQNLLLNNYITPINIGGPRLAAIGSVHRGAIALSGKNLNSEFEPAPMVKLFAHGGKIHQDSVRIVGAVSDPGFLEVIMHVNDQTYNLAVTAGVFETTVYLNRGQNKIYARALYNTNKLSVSKSITYDYVFDPAPVVKIMTRVIGDQITLDGAASYNPDGLPMAFSWHQDSTNPEPVVLATPNNASTGFTAPALAGEYYFTLKVTVGNYSGWARTVIVIDDGVHTVDLATWHPAWVDSMILYEIFTRTFSVTGKLSAVKGRMSLLKDFGINCIWFMPLHPTPATHGYWITDYYDINPEHGTQEDFRQVVEEAHKYGIKVIMDLVINHTVDTHPFMLDALENGTFSPYRDFYSWDNNGNYDYLYTWVNLPSINYRPAWVRDYLIDMCKWWVQKFDIDGFRCDVAHAIEELRPEGAAFWQRWRRELKEMKPDIFLLAEADASNARYFNGKFDSGYDYRFYGEIRNALSGTSSANNLNQVVMHYITNVPAHARPMRYIENHDESRFLANFSRPQTRLAAVLSFTLPGIPLIYAGQETGELSSRGVVHWSDPDQLKPFYENLIRIRKHHPSLTHGRYMYLPGKNANVYCFLRKQDENLVLIIANLSGSEQTATITVPLAEVPFDTSTTFYLNELLTNTFLATKATRLQNYQVTLMENQALIYEFSTTATGVEQVAFHPAKFDLSCNYPNPFNVATTIQYGIGGTQPIETILEIYNILGQKIKTLVHEKQTPGRYQVTWNGDNNVGIPVGSGVYFYRFRSGKFVKTIKMVVLK